MKFDDLYFIADGLNKENIRWVVCSSVVLYFHDIINMPNDIDIIVDKKDLEQTIKLFNKIGIQQTNEKKEPYITEKFLTYLVNETSIDIMCNFGLKHELGDYRFKMDADAIVEAKKIHNTTIPLSSLEDWYVLYQLMPGREAKVKLIEDYLKNNGVNNEKLLRRALNQNLPQSIVSRIYKLLHEND